ncbi:MAG: hypothetical protein HY681_07215 [Chloroflexi bacterium]|nr:hypothetical protein [Chloroflexota bacterium]
MSASDDIVPDPRAVWRAWYGFPTMITSVAVVEAEPLTRILLCAVGRT